MQLSVKKLHSGHTYVSFKVYCREVSVQGIIIMTYTYLTYSFEKV